MAGGNREEELQDVTSQYPLPEDDCTLSGTRSRAEKELGTLLGEAGTTLRGPEAADL